MEKFTFLDLLVAISFALACLAIGIGLRAAICGKHQTKEETKSQNYYKKSCGRKISY